VLFNSLQFAAFFPVVTLLYFALPHRRRSALLLAASCVFYMAFIPAYIAMLFVTIFIDSAAALRIERSAGSRRRAWLVVSVLATCAVLFSGLWHGARWTFVIWAPCTGSISSSRCSRPTLALGFDPRSA
jgi:D-alanyl-lipoteichoic acid acyltransferase DltB (MBOAT superfamily)